jgi:hypothetical protein
MIIGPATEVPRNSGHPRFDNLDLPYQTGTFAISRADQPSTTCGFGSEELPSSGSAWLLTFGNEIGITGCSRVLYLDHRCPDGGAGPCGGEVVPNAKRHVLVAWLPAHLFASSLASMQGSPVVRSG